MRSGAERPVEGGRGRWFPTDGGKLGAVDSGHGQPADLGAAAQVEEGEADDANLFVGARGAAVNEASRVLAGADLLHCQPGVGMPGRW